MGDGASRADYLQSSTDLWKTVEGEIIEEAPLTLYVNGQEWVTLMCTPVGLDDLVLGFLLAEGVIGHLQEVRLLVITQGGAVADVWLRHQALLPHRRVLTSGCAGGTTFTGLATIRSPVRSTRKVTREQVLTLMEQLQGAAVLYRRGGAHVGPERRRAFAGRRRRCWSA